MAHDGDEKQPTEYVVRFINPILVARFLSLSRPSGAVKMSKV